MVSATCGGETATLVRLHDGRPTSTTAPLDALAGLVAPADDVRRGGHILLPTDAIVCDTLAKIDAYLNAARNGADRPRGAGEARGAEPPSVHA